MGDSRGLDARDEASILPHVAQLRNGFRGLRFAPVLEAEFLDFYWKRYFGRTRVALLLGALIFCLFAFKDVRTLPEDVWHWTAGIRILVIVPVILLVVGLSFAFAVGRWIEPLITAGLLIAMNGLSVALLISRYKGYPVPYEGLILVVVFGFFLSGLRFWKASAISLVSALAFVIGSQIMPMPSTHYAPNAYYLFSIIGIGMVGSYSLERVLRHNFLTERVAEFRSTRDPLTLLRNRRAAFVHLDLAWRLARRERAPFGIFLIDVDHFKKYNDRYGHLAGDGCLSELAMAFSGCLRRPMDLIARYGGEEFVGVVYDISEPELRQSCERLCQTVRNLDIPHEGSPEHRVTISLGAVLANPTEDGIPVETLLQRADAALYQAKQAGRDRYVLAEPARADSAAA